MKTNVYIDGFNLYYRCLRGTEHKWLDVRALCQRLLHNANIVSIKYFTAVVQPLPADLQSQQRQQTYIRALKTIPGLTVHYGRFETKAVSMPLADDPSEEVSVLRRAEKGSDVALAAHLIMDGLGDDAYGSAIVMSSDSDLEPAIQVVREQLKKPLGIIKTGEHAVLPADFYRQIRRGPLRVSQFPDTLTDAKGTITKPAEW